MQESILDRVTKGYDEPLFSRPLSERLPPQGGYHPGPTGAQRARLGIPTLLDQVTQGYTPPATEYIKAAPKNFARGAMGVVAGALEAPSDILNPGEDTLGTLLGGEVRRASNALRTPDVERAPDGVGKFIAEDVASGAGSSAAFLAGGGITAPVLRGAGMAAGAARSASVMSLGAASGVAEGYNDAKAHGASDSAAWWSGVINGLVGTSENAPISAQLGRIMDRADILSGGVLRKMAEEGGEEFLQESGQTLAGNFIAQALVGYDQDRELMDGVLRAGAAGALTGAIQSGLATKYGDAKRRAEAGRLIASRVVPKGTNIDLTGGGPSFAEQGQAAPQRMTYQPGVGDTRPPPFDAAAPQAGPQPAPQAAPPPHEPQRKQEVRVAPEDTKSAASFAKEVGYRGRFYAPSSAADESADAITRATGRRAYFFDLPGGPQGATHGGAIYLNLSQPDDTKIDWVLNHELWHVAERAKPEMAKGFARAVASFPDLLSRARAELAAREGIENLPDDQLAEKLASAWGRSETGGYAMELLGALPRAAAANPEAAYRAAAADPGFWRGMLDTVLKVLQTIGMMRGRELQGARVAREWVEKYGDQSWHRETDPQKLAQIAINAGHVLTSLKTEAVLPAPARVTYQLPMAAGPGMQEVKAEAAAKEQDRVRGVQQAKMIEVEQRRLGQRERRPIKLGAPEQPKLLGQPRDLGAIESDRRARRRLRPRAEDATVASEPGDVVRVPTKPHQKRYGHPLLKVPKAELERMLKDETAREELFTRPVLENAGWSEDRIKNFLRTRKIGRESKDAHEKAIAHDVITKMKRTLSPAARAELERTETGYPIEEIQAAIDQRRAGSKKKAREIGAQLRFSKPPVERAKPDRLGFYSAMEDVILQKMPAKSTAHQVVGIITGAGVKADELEWTGIKEWLEGKTNVTKAEVLEFIRANDIGITETQLTQNANGGSDNPVDVGVGWRLFRANFTVEELAQFDRDYGMVIENGEWLLVNEDDDGYPLARARADMTKREAMISMVPDIEDSGVNPYDVFVFDSDRETNDAQYDSHVLPGPKTDYRELLLHLPNDESRLMARSNELMSRGMLRSESLAEAARQLGIENRPIGGDEIFEAPHFHPHHVNLLAHMRVDVRTPVGLDKTMLFAEEFQSDWHQQGSEKGYRDPGLSARREAADEEYKGAFAVANSIDRSGRMATAAEVAEAEERLWSAQEELRAIEQAWSSTIPDAPFKKTWHELVMKRLIALAVEKGNDMIGWTTGIQQIERWSGQMRRMVSKITASALSAAGHRNHEDGKPKVLITAHSYASGSTSWGDRAFEAWVPLEGTISRGGEDYTLDQIVGREIAKKIRDGMAADPKYTQTFEGDDLSIGGHFHKQLYDEKFVQAANAIGKKFGVKARKVTIAANGTRDDAIRRPGEPRAPEHTVWALDIPPEMAKVVKEVGLARFSKRRKPMSAAERKRLMDRVSDVKAAAGKAFEDGEETKVGSTPSRLAVTEDDDTVRAFQRGARETLAKDKDVQHIDEVEARAEAALEQDHDGVLADVMAKVRRGDALNSEETVQADKLWQEAVSTWMSSDKNADFVKAIDIYTAYDSARQEAGRALGVIRDARKGPRERALEAVVRPTPRMKSQMKRLNKLRKSMAANDPRLKRLEERIAKLATKEAKRVKKTLRELERAGINPDAITDGYFNDPVVYRRFAQAVANGKGTWQEGFTEWYVAGLTSNFASQAANITGNVAHTAYTVVMRRMAEAAVNTVVKDKDSPTFKENVEFMRAFLPSLARAGRNLIMAYRTDLPVYELELHGRGVPGTAISGRSESHHLGSNLPWPLRLIRYPSLTSLMAFDEFFKTIVGEMTASAYAWRKAKQEGASDPRSRALELMADPDFWREAHGIEDGQGLQQARKSAFQDHDSPVLNYLNRMLDAVDDKARFPVSRLFFPFRNTPFRIFQVGLDMPLHPLIALGNLVTGQHKGNPRLAVQDLAQTAMSVGITLAVLSMIDDPDDKDRPFITGSRAQDFGKSMNQQAVAPAMSIKIGGDYYSYSRIEPFATAIAAIVDMANAAKDEGGDPIAPVGALAGSITNQAGDKTFMKGIGDIQQLIESTKVEGGEVKTSDYSKRILRDLIVTPFVPRIIPGVIRSGDEFVRPDTLRKYEDDGGWSLAASSAWRKHLPTEGNVPPPRYDWLGRPMKADGRGFLSRLVSPVKLTGEAADVQKLDLLIKRWNDAVRDGKYTGEDGKPYFPKPPDYWFDRNKEQHYWSLDEYEVLQRESGQAVLRSLSNRNMNWEDPRPRDIEIIKSTVRRERRRVANRLFRERGQK